MNSVYRRNSFDVISTGSLRLLLCAFLVRISSKPPSNASLVPQIHLAEFLLQITFFTVDHAAAHDQENDRKEQNGPQQIREKGDSAVEQRQRQIQWIPRDSEGSF